MPYIAGAALVVALTVFWRVSVHKAYTSGYEARAVEQEAIDAETFQEIIKEYNNATDSPISDAAADCILRRIASNAEGDECGDL